MESLIALSSSTSLIFGLIGPLELTQLKNGILPNTFFETSAGVAGFMNLGIYLEERLRGRAAKHIEDLTKLMYGKARLSKIIVQLKLMFQILNRGMLWKLKLGR